MRPPQLAASFIWSGSSNGNHAMRENLDHRGPNVTALGNLREALIRPQKGPPSGHSLGLLSLLPQASGRARGVGGWGRPTGLRLLQRKCWLCGSANCGACHRESLGPRGGGPRGVHSSIYSAQRL